MLVCECVHMISGAGFGYVTLDLIVAQHSKRRGEEEEERTKSRKENKRRHWRSTYVH